MVEKKCGNIFSTVPFAFSANLENLPHNLKGLLHQLGSMKDRFKDVIVMADPMTDDRLQVPLWKPIKATVDHVRNTTFPEIKFMDSHIALYRKYAEFEDK